MLFGNTNVVQLLLLVVVVVIVCMLHVGDCDSTHTPPIVGIEMADVGYHRDLFYTVQFDYPLAGKEECEYVLEQPLPAAVYVSVDQLNDLQRLQKLNAFYPKFVDIEVPTEMGTPFSVLLLGMPKITDSIKLPIHFRYHAARADGSSFVQVQLTTPTMYMRCSMAHNQHDNDILSDNELLANAPDVRYCLHTQVDSPHMELAEDEDEVSNDCSWQEVRVDYQLKSPLHANIPVGNTKAYSVVLIITIVASWAAMLWIVFRTQNVPRRINQKLEEQRILQRKIK